MSIQCGIADEMLPDQALSAFSGGEIEWPPLKTLETGLLPVQPITPDMLPEPLSSWLVDIAKRMDHAPFEYGAVTAVVILGSLLGRKLGIHPKRQDDWKVIPNLWGCCVGTPGVKKSPVMKSVMRPLNKMEDTERLRYQQECDAFEVQEKLNKFATQQAETEAKGLVKSKRFSDAEALLADDSGIPTKPVPKRYIIHDSSVEKTGILLSQNPWGLLQYRDELSGWLSKMRQEDRQQDRAFMLEAFNGDGSFSYDRVTRDDVYMPSNTLSVLGTIQPAKLLPLLKYQKEHFGGDGLMDRLQLMVYPDRSEMCYEDLAPNEELEIEAFLIFKKFDEIPYHEGESTPCLRFNSEAQELFKIWYLGLHKKIELAGCNQIANHLSKYASLMPSLALIFHCIMYEASGQINQQCIEMAIRWCDVLETHVRRIYALIDDPLAPARTLLSRLKRLPSPFKMADLEGKGWSGLKGRSEREQALIQLEVHGYIVRLESDTGGRRSVDFHINPKILRAEN